MNPEPPEDSYDAWLARRRQDFNGTDLSFLVMNSVRSAGARPVTSGPHLVSCFGLPSTLVGIARLILFLLLILTPA